MAKTRSAASRALTAGLFRDVVAPKHRTLFLPRFLAAKAKETRWEGPDRDKAHAIVVEWARLADTHALDHKETALDGDFLERIFGRALGYNSVSESPQAYQRQKQFHVPGVGTADGSLGAFTDTDHKSPIAIIELKGGDTDLDHDKFNHRTPVQQCWDYLNSLPDCPWGIVSNYRMIRLYHRDRTPQAYEEFHFHDLIDPTKFSRFWYVFERGGLLASKIEPARALVLLKATRERQKDAGDDLYNAYSDQRTALIRHLIDDHKLAYDDAIAAAQKLLDRVIFIAFCADRGLLRENIIDDAIKDRPKFRLATNPIWKNFKVLFGWIDKGEEAMEIPPFNGGLFATDKVVDNLELSDDWTHFFATIDIYDFRDEVNVEVLGHLFEKSITELEKLRVVGFFGPQAGKSDQPEMPKSALRKRFGTYYTPANFTELIVNHTVGQLIEQRVEPLATVSEKLTALRALKIVDPACGSGAFLIAAYERLDDAYGDLVRLLRIDKDEKSAAVLEAAYPDYILHDNLYGVDLSREAVEITQLALWIRSARKDKTLADLSKNIVWGNSLVSDQSVHPKAMDWQATFLEVFKKGGFDCVIGNPPWERMKVQEREFFSLAAPEIASTANAADRSKLVKAIEKNRPDLWMRYVEAQADAEKMLAYVRRKDAGFPLTGRGDVNTYMVFAELARKLVARKGRVGLIVPSGIATDKTMQAFFNEMVESRTLTAIYDFVNRRGLFADVEGRLKFCILLMNGSDVPHDVADFVFFAEQVEELADQKRHVSLSADDLRLFNPNTRTCPIFRSSDDLELTRTVYRRVPVLIDKNRKKDGNPWGIRLSTMFHATNDAEHFVTPDKLTSDGFTLDGNVWRKKTRTVTQSYLPLYEAKMTRDYDHRATVVKLGTGNWYMNYEAVSASLVDHQNPEFVPIGRWWVAEEEVLKRIHPSQRVAAIGFHDVARSTDQRTMVPCMIPLAAVANTLPLIVNAAGMPWRRFCCLLGNLGSFAYDFVTRQKAGGAHLNFFIVEQLPTLPPDAYDDKCPWDKQQTLEQWISGRVLRLTCTSNDMLPLAQAADFKPGIVKWKEAEREQIRAELDAAYFRLYGIDDADIEYILGTFQGVRDEDGGHGGVGQTRQLITEALERLAM